MVWPVRTAVFLTTAWYPSKTVKENGEVLETETEYFVLDVVVVVVVQEPKRRPRPKI